MSVVKARIKCDYCDKTYADRSSLQQHLESVHKNKKPCIFGFDIDVRTEQSKSALSAHLRRVFARKPLSVRSMSSALRSAIGWPSTRWNIEVDSDHYFKYTYPCVYCCNYFGCSPHILADHIRQRFKITIKKEQSSNDDDDLKTPLSPPINRMILLLLILLVGVTFSQLHTHSHDHGGDDHAVGSASRSSIPAPSQIPSSKLSSKRGVGVGHAHSHSSSVVTATDDDADGGTADNTSHRKTTSPSALSSKASALLIWSQAFGATILISIAPIVMLAFIPLRAASEDSPLLRVLLAFAAGGLLGDVFLHLLPHSMASSGGGGESHSHSHHEHSDAPHSHSLASLSSGLWILAGITIFLIIEKAVRAAHSSRGSSAGSHSHAHSHASSAANENDADDEKDDSEDVSSDAHDDDEDDGDDDESDDVAPRITRRRAGSLRSTSPSRVDLRRRKNTSTPTSTAKSTATASGAAKKSRSKTKPHHNHHQRATTSSSTASASTVLSAMKVHGWLNLAADFAHNFTDGLAIGATFHAGQRLGVVTTLAILLHEVPHEIGDFAILLQCGLNKRQAMMAQATTAIGAMVGTLIDIQGLLADNVTAAAAWVLPLTAGGFLYIAMTSVLPSLLQPASTTQSAIEIGAILLGICLMMIIAMIE